MVRVATRDTDVLGYPIPKGAFINCNSFVCDAPQDGVPESARSERSRRQKRSFRWFRRDGKEDVGMDLEMDEFRPERWLDGEGRFDVRRYPRLAFSLGPRGCFGESFFFSSSFFSVAFPETSVCDARSRR